MQILAIAGSLRAGSSNASVVRAAAALAPAGVSVSIYEGLGEIPPFNPDLDTETGPPAVMSFRAQLQRADAVLISSPEYAHGVPGVLKNALDWVVGSGEFVNKPLALVSASPRATYAQASLTETLTTMMAILIPQACIALPLPSRSIGESGIVADPELSAMLSGAVAALAAAVPKS